MHLEEDAESDNKAHNAAYHAASQAAINGTSHKVGSIGRQSRPCLHTAPQQPHHKGGHEQNHLHGALALHACELGDGGEQIVPAIVFIAERRDVNAVIGNDINHHGRHDELDMAEAHKEKCQARMLEICEREFPEELKRLQTIPGIKERAATSLIAEIGTDMNKFETANHLASWSGLKPRNDESNKKIKSRSITHGNVYLRKTIIECAWAASRTKDCFFSRFSFHQTQVRKKNKMKVLVAVARQMLVALQDDHLIFYLSVPVR